MPCIPAASLPTVPCFHVSMYVRAVLHVLFPVPVDEIVPSASPDGTTETTDDDRLLCASAPCVHDRDNPGTGHGL